jgi:hypothetical protein
VILGATLRVSAPTSAAPDDAERSDVDGFDRVDAEVALWLAGFALAADHPRAEAGHQDSLPGVTGFRGGCSLKEELNGRQAPSLIAPDVPWSEHTRLTARAYLVDM